MSEKSKKLFESFISWIGIKPEAKERFLVNLTIFILASIVMLIVDPTDFSPDVVEGRPAEKTIRSPRLISFNDEAKTSELRFLERDKVEPVYSSIEGAEEAMFARFATYTHTLNQYFVEVKKLPNYESAQTLIAMYFPRPGLLDNDKLTQLRTLRPLQFENLIESSRKVLINFSQRQISAQNIETVRSQLKSYVDAFPEGRSYRGIMTELVRNALTVNSIEDEVLTKQRREAAMRAIQPVIRIFQKGQKIVDEGAIVTAEDYYILKNIASQMKKNKLLSAAGSMLLLLLSLVLSLFYLRTDAGNVLEEQDKFRLLLVLWLVCMFLTKLLHLVCTVYDKSFLYVLFAPLPAVALLLVILINSRVALFHTTMFGILTLIVAESNARFAAVSMFGALSAILAWRCLDRKGDDRRIIGASGVRAGFANAVAALGFMLIEAETLSDIDMQKTSLLLGLGLLNGAVSGILVNGILPYLEGAFRLATNSRLLELADLSQPLLKRLAEDAPETYQHSIAVANLAETAANAVNADSLLTKIAAYFHDIGKVKRPLYFTENQHGGENPHDQLTPHMSSLIITGHVRESIDLGREYGLPEDVLSVMAQHHGTTLVSYFFNKAKLKDGEGVDPEPFRYPGPKPQTREAAILMLADASEAATRAAKQHTYNKIVDVVESVINSKQNKQGDINSENQFDECGLTFKDIEIIKSVLIKSLVSMYHGRIEYEKSAIAETLQPKGTSDEGSERK